LIFKAGRSAPPSWPGAVLAKYIFIFSIIFIGSGFAILIKIRLFFLGMEITQEAVITICFGQ